MVKRSLYLVLLLGSVGVANAKEKPIKLGESSMFSNLESVVAPSISNAPNFTVVMCQHPNIAELCEVKVTAVGFGAKRVLLLKRNGNGMTPNLASKDVGPSGSVEYLLRFDETGTYNVLFLAEDNSGKVLALDGAVVYVEPRNFFHSYRIDVQLPQQSQSDQPNDDGGD